MILHCLLLKSPISNVSTGCLARRRTGRLKRCAPRRESSRCARTRTAAHLNEAIRSSSEPAESRARSNCTRVPGRSLASREKYLRAGLTELTIARSQTIPRGPPLSPHVQGMERIRASATASVVGAQGRMARRFRRGLRSPRSFPYTGAASVHLARHAQPIENLSFSTHSLPLHSADFNVHFSIATRKRRREGQNGPATSGVYAHTLSSARLTLVLVRFASRESSALAQGPTCLSTPTARFQLA